MNKKSNNSSEFVVDEMIKDYWNVLCDRQRCKIKIPLKKNLDYGFLKGCIVGFIISSIVYYVFNN